MVEFIFHWFESLIISTTYLIMKNICKAILLLNQYLKHLYCLINTQAAFGSLSIPNNLLSLQGLRRPYLIKTWGIGLARVCSKRKGSTHSFGWVAYCTTQGSRVSWSGKTVCNICYKWFRFTCSWCNSWWLWLTQFTMALRCFGDMREREWGFSSCATLRDRYTNLKKTLSDNC